MGLGLRSGSKSQECLFIANDVDGQTAWVIASENSIKKILG